MERPVFYDASGQRDRWSKRFVGLLLALLVIGAIAFAWTIAYTPATSGADFGSEHPARRPIAERIVRARHAAGEWLPRRTVPAGLTAKQLLSVGFYVPWDKESLSSLERNIGALDWVIPSVARITNGGANRYYAPDPGFRQVVAASPRRPLILPMIQNTSEDDQWDGVALGKALSDPAKRAALTAWAAKLVAAENGAGIVFDFEQLPASALADYREFLRETHAAFAPRGWQVTLAVPLDDPAWNMPQFAAVADRLILMNYDQHASADDPGPVSAQPWFVANLKRVMAQIPAQKAIVALGGYGYDFSAKAATDLTLGEAWLSAHDSDATPTFDPISGNTGFRYEDDDGAHQVWMLDAATNWNQMRATQATGAAGFALWRLGSEDPGYWADVAALRTATLPKLSTIAARGNVDVEGTGELLRIANTPREGARRVTFDASNLVRGQDYTTLPTPYVVARSGYHPKQVALTFDDGPDAVWTPKILDILEAKHAVATFFVVGENAVMHPWLLNRILEGGSEIGNHSYTHPNLANVSPGGVDFELNATQRLIEAYTGHSTRFFRAPYFGDAEPTTSDELGPALIAQQRGYLNVGLHADPNDWQRPGVQAIVDQTLAQVINGTPDGPARIVLLHDAGGDRSQTVAALPAIIDGLRARGFTLVAVSTLAGVTRNAAMPPVASGQLLQMRADVAGFVLAASVLLVLKWLFFLAIALGIGRAVLMTVLAVRERRRERARIVPAIEPDRFVSVLIPAFNEERVIVDSVRRVLASEQVALEVIVIDDGSSDATSARVREAFAADARVRLMTLTNGGKARALNQALAVARGDVVIALDADTHFEPMTVARLARWFVDSDIGAVAGNAKVGNRVNLVTRWQAIEYVTAQNLERQALVAFDAITVVPGAVGAWRRSTLDAVGGYPVDTLAEDQDLTLAIQRKGWRVAYDREAVAWTEAPESFRSLAKQRFRWAFGTLQCLWKHRAILRDRRPAGLALVGIPQAWLFQIAFAVISPIIDFALVVNIVDTAMRVNAHGWAQTRGDVLTMAVYWVAFTAIDVVCGGVAYALDRGERRYPVFLLVAQRFIYRQLMYWVVLRAVSAAMRGPSVGWGKLERTGRVAA